MQIIKETHTDWWVILYRLEAIDCLEKVSTNLSDDLSLALCTSLIVPGFIEIVPVSGLLSLASIQQRIHSISVNGAESSFDSTSPLASAPFSCANFRPCTEHRKFDEWPQMLKIKKKLSKTKNLLLHRSVLFTDRTFEHALLWGFNIYNNSRGSGIQKFPAQGDLCGQSEKRGDETCSMFPPFCPKFMGLM